MDGFRSVKLCAMCIGLALGLIIGLEGKAPVKAEETRQLGLDSVKPWTGDLDGMAKRRIVRILVPYSKTMFFLDKGKQYGTVVELGRAFEKVLNKGKKRAIEQVNVVLVPTARERLFTALNEGLGDIVAASLTITSDRQQLVDFAAPFASGIKEVLVTGAGAPAFARIEDLSGHDLYLRQSSSYHEHALALNARLKAAGQAQVNIVAAEEMLEDEDLLEMVSAGLLPYAVVDEPLGQLWTKVLPNLTVRSDLVLNQGGDIAWAVRKNSPRLKAAITSFVATHRVGTTFGNIVKKRYYTSDKMAKQALTAEAQDNLHRLEAHFRKHGEDFGFEYLLIAAQGFQESGLDQSKRSPRGAVGVMQLLPSTAADKSIGVPDIKSSAERNIYAGAKYLRYLISTYVGDDKSIDDRNRVLFAFAAYNAGPGNLKKFREKAKAMGLDPNVWFGNVENGAADTVGRETVQYVANIYKYYIAYKLATKLETQRDDAEKLMESGNP